MTMDRAAVTLAGFLAARLDEDEAAAKAVYGFWRAHQDADAGDEFLIRFNPVRMLRDVEAKRRVLQRHRECGSGIGYCDDGGHGSDGTDPGCGEMEDLAAPYSDHPDYNPAWQVA